MALTQLNSRELRNKLELHLNGYLSHATRDKYGWRLFARGNPRYLCIDELMMHQLVGYIPHVTDVYYFEMRNPYSTYSGYNDIDQISPVLTATEVINNSQLLKQQKYNQTYSYYNVSKDFYQNTYYDVKVVGTKVIPPKENGKSAKLRKLFWHRFSKLGINPFEEKTL